MTSFPLRKDNNGDHVIRMNEGHFFGRVGSNGDFLIGLLT